MDGTFEKDILKMMRDQLSKGRMLEFWKHGEEYTCQVFVPLSSQGGMRGYTGKALTMIGSFSAALDSAEAT